MSKWSAERWAETDYKSESQKLLGTSLWHYDSYHEEVVGVEGEVIERGKPAITVNLLVTLGLTVYDYYARTSSRVVFHLHNQTH